ncbi:MAG: glycoside hydrolase family 3 protein [Lachnospiraceae bacterium]|nr:glycoside hydrolase family 3 protein [Lachnospiraceae bacterium]
MNKIKLFLSSVIIAALAANAILFNGCTVNINANFDLNDINKFMNINSLKETYNNETDIDNTIEAVVAKMSLDEKISQMIIPSMRTWEEENVTDLNSFDELKEALQKHQYGGVLLYGSNITGNRQVSKLINDLQENNAGISNASVHIPYLMPVDEEGGIVLRLTNGTRMTGNMAIGATPDPVTNAEKTGTIIGEELAALGFNADFAPVIDVNNNPANPVIGTRSFSDDPNRVSKLGAAYSKGLEENNIIATYKHFPGHGDTETDSHIGTPSVEKTYDEILNTELIPFKNAISNGADLIMTAHITYPLIDEEHTFGDGTTKGYYPATMSEKMITDILRRDLGYDGAVITDALEMDAIKEAKLVPGEADSTEYRVNIAKEVINAGVDILLLPADMIDPETVDFYDEYINEIAAKTEAGEISEERINESVKRILKLKIKYQIFNIDAGEEDNNEDEQVSANILTVGSKEHHEQEMDMARQAITLVKNNEDILPLSDSVKNIVFFGRREADSVTINYAVNSLKEEGIIKPDQNILVEYYYDPSSEEKLHYTDEIRENISSADIVIGFSYNSGNSSLDKENPQYTAMTSAIGETHKAGGKFIMISENLPYDAALYPDADAVLLAYLGSGLDIDPTERNENPESMPARNANIAAAIETAFGANTPVGKLPVNIPVIEEQPDGTLSYGEDCLYERDFGLTF